MAGLLGKLRRPRAERIMEGRGKSYFGGAVGNQKGRFTDL